MIRVTTPIVIILIALCFAIVSKGQDADRLAERIVPVDEADLNYEDLYENLSQLATHPLNLNRASRDELLSLGILSQAQVNNLVQYRGEHGDLLEIYELQCIPGFDVETIHGVLPYVSVGPTPSARNFFERIWSQQSSYFLTRFERILEQSRGYSTEADSASKYRGDPTRIYSRFRMTSPGDLSVGFTAEKDAGEQFVWGTKSLKGLGFDFYSGHFQLMNKGPFVNIIAGDYVAQFGQGLTLGGGFGAGKGSETITTLRRTSTGFTPYTSANESGFFRGVAATARLPGSLLLHAFASSLPRDASQSDENSLAVLQSGKHRTMNELKGRHQLIEQNFGAAVEYKGQLFEAGVVAHRTVFGQPIARSPTVYNSFDHNGDANTNVGAFGSYALGSFSVFGEYARTIGGGADETNPVQVSVSTQISGSTQISASTSNSKPPTGNYGSGLVAGILGSISRSIDVSLLFRRYDTDYHTFYSNAISENTAPRNERGVYWGWKHSITRKLSYTAYVDLFTFPWLKFRNYMPSAGSESLVRITYRVSKTAEFYLQFRDERKNRNFSSEAVTSALPPATQVDQAVIGSQIHLRNQIHQTYQSIPAFRQNWILSSSLKFGDLSLKTRVQYSSYRQHTTTHGFAIAFDALYDWSKVSIDTRIAIFDTDDFDNRQYMNERDVLMAFSFPAYNGEGTRAYVVARYKPAKWIDLSAKFARTVYFHSTSSGSGGDTINGNTRRDVKVQAIFRLD